MRQIFSSGLLASHQTEPRRLDRTWKRKENPQDKKATDRKTDRIKTKPTEQVSNRQKRIFQWSASVASDITALPWPYLETGGETTG